MPPMAEPRDSSAHLILNPAVGVQQRIWVG
jgi:hypothetical protein